MGGREVSRDNISSPKGEDFKLSSRIEEWIENLKKENSPSSLVRARYIATFLRIIQTSSSVVSSSSSLRTAVILRNMRLQQKDPGSRITPLFQFEAKHSAEAWLKKHPDSKIAQVITERGLAASLSEHLTFVKEMHQERVTNPEGSTKNTISTQPFENLISINPNSASTDSPSDIFSQLPEEMQKDNYKRRGKIREIPQQLPIWIIKGVEEDINATEGIYNYLSKILYSYFIRRLPKEAEDLVQVTLLKVFKDFRAFVNSGGGGLIDNFHSWVFAIARNSLNQELSKHITALESNISLDQSMENYSSSREKATLSEKVTSFKDLPKLIPQFDSLLKQILTKREWQVISLIMSGSNCQSVAGGLGIKTKSAIGYLVKGRKKIEKLLIYPAGFKRLSAMESKGTLVNAAWSGSLEAIKFLNIWYADDVSIRNYRLQSRLVDKEITSRGYLPVSTSVTPREYSSLLYNSKYRKFLKVIGGRVYVSKENLEEFRENYSKGLSANTILSQEDLELGRLSTFVGTSADAVGLLKAAKTGKLKAVKLGKSWFTTKRAYEEFMMVYPRRAQSHDSSPFPTLEDTNGFILTKENINLQYLVNAAKRGDEKAIGILKNYAETSLSKTFARRLSGDLRQLLKISSEKTILNLGSFSYSGKFHFWLEFKIWLYEQAMLMINEEKLRRKEKNTKPDKKESRLYELDFIISHERLSQLLNETQLKVFDLKTQGKSNPMISSEMEIPVKVLDKSIKAVRKIIEVEFVFPHGLKRLSEVKEKALQIAARQRRMTAYKVFGVWYTSDEAIKDYKLGLEGFDPMLGRDYLLLSKYATSAEYTYIFRSLEYRQLLVKREGFNYIHKEDLEKIRRERETRYQKKSTPNIESSKTIFTHSDYLKVQRKQSRKGNV